MSNFAVVGIARHDNWSTPKDLFIELDAEFHFNDDPCPLYGKENGLDGLDREWGARTFINPPYRRGEVDKWVEKAYLESLKGKTIVALLRLDPTTKWFHRYILGKAEVRMVTKRLKFGGAERGAAFASMIVIWRGA
jgi:site-specific DNA-methyltransferase (adenine-specific)